MLKFLALLTDKQFMLSASTYYKLLSVHFALDEAQRTFLPLYQHMPTTHISLPFNLLFHSHSSPTCKTGTVKSSQEQVQTIRIVLQYGALRVPTYWCTSRS